jgi:hypothetical protein
MSSIFAKVEQKHTGANPPVIYYCVYPDGKRQACTDWHVANDLANAYNTPLKAELEASAGG